MCWLDFVYLKKLEVTGSCGWLHNAISFKIIKLFFFYQYNICAYTKCATVCKNSIRLGMESIHGWTGCVIIQLHPHSMFTYRYILMHMPAAVFLAVSFASLGIYHLFGLLAAFSSDFKKTSAPRN